MLRGSGNEDSDILTANGRIPAIIDRTPTPEGKTREKRVFEGQAIMLYLCQKYDKDYKISFPFDSDKFVPFPLLS
jgi:glutathione S-transferase